MQCPSCASDNVQKLSIIYENGTNDIETRSNTSYGGPFSHSGTASTKTTGKSQSKLAQKAEPPAKKSYGIGIIALLVGLFFFGFNIALALLLLVVAGIFLYIAYTYNKNQWPGSYNQWQKSWHCNKCGSIYAH